MAGVSRIFGIARTLGDTSSLMSGSVGGRVERRVVGRGVSKIFQMNVFGLIMWAEFFAFLNGAIQVAAAKDVWVGTVVPYAAGYEFGFANPVGRRTRRPYFFDAVAQMQQEFRFGGSRGGAGLLSVSRSGVYSQGRFLADIRSVARGRVVARGIRRVAGREASKLFWGSLRNPQRNILHAQANRIITLARRNVRGQELIDTRALLMSIQQGDSFTQMRTRSLTEAIARGGRGRKFSGTTTRALP